MSRLGFVQVAGLKLDHLCARNVVGSLQTNEQLLDLIKLNRVPRKAGNVVRQAIIWTLRVGHVKRPGQGPYVLCGRRGSWLIHIMNIALFDRNSIDVGGSLSKLGRGTVPSFGAQSGMGPVRSS